MSWPIRLAAVLALGSTAGAAEGEWARFRGPNGSGISEAANVPAKWTERDYNWRIKLPGTGSSSPVVWGKRIFVTCGEPETAKWLILRLLRLDPAHRQALTLRAKISACYGPTKDAPWTNSLGMKFVPVRGTDVLFSIWDTRVQDFEAFVQASGYDATKDMHSLRDDGYKQRGDTWKSPGFTQGPTHPVVGVSWEDAEAFCAWLTKKEQGEGRLQTGQSYRLPTDAEWSIAVGLGREEGSTPEEKSGKIKDVYPWGNQWPPPRGAGNYWGEESEAGAPPDWKVIGGYNDGYPRASPVGSFDANQFGLYDIGGNVWQWCEDLYKPSEQWRVMRGAAWFLNAPDYLRSSYRGYVLPGRRFDDIGFRCVLLHSRRSSNEPRR